jgi:hypothetical protein
MHAEEKKVDKPISIRENKDFHFKNLNQFGGFDHSVQLSEYQDLRKRFTSTYRETK